MPKPLLDSGILPNPLEEIPPMLPKPTLLNSNASDGLRYVNDYLSSVAHDEVHNVYIPRGKSSSL